MGGQGLGKRAEVPRNFEPGQSMLGVIVCRNWGRVQVACFPFIWIQVDDVATPPRYATVRAQHTSAVFISDHSDW